jgi:hypothetical protein
VSILAIGLLASSAKADDMVVLLPMKTRFLNNVYVLLESDRHSHDSHLMLR